MADNELDPSTYLFDQDEGEPRRAYVKNMDSTWIGLKVRVRVSGTLIIEDVISGVNHFSTVTRIYFKNTKAYPSLFSQDEGYMIDRDQLIEALPEKGAKP